MLNKSNVNIKLIIAEIVSAIYLTFCVIPGFNLIGNLFSQITVTVFLSVLFLLVADLIFKIQPYIISHSLIIMTVFWITSAVIKQIQLHALNNDLSVKWNVFFYYDKPAMLFVVFFTCIIYFIIKLICKRNDEAFINQYSKFIKNTLIVFLAYYIVILIYCFILCREMTFVPQNPNLIPFEMIKFTFSLGRIDYELLFLFLGNIAIFLPLGILVSALIKNKITLALIPVFLSVGIEISQYFLGNGHPDVDDVILNILGFYLGILIKKLIDIILEKSSKGKLKSFFIF